jgi:hypothetical protein
MSEAFQKIHNGKIENTTPRVGGVIIWFSVLIVTIGMHFIAKLVNDPIMKRLDFLSRGQTLLPLAALFFGGLFGLCLLLFRTFIKDFQKVTPKKISEIATESVRNKEAFLQAVIVASMLVLVFYASLIYVNELVHQELGISRSQIFKANSLLLGLWIVLPPCFGYIADKFAFSYRKMMRFGALGVFLSAPFLGLSVVFASYAGIIIAQIVVHLFHMVFCLCTPRFFGDLFAGSARNTAVSTSYSLGASFTAALAPMICYMSINLFHTNFAICVPFMLVALMTIFTLKEEMIYAKG